MAQKKGFMAKWFEGPERTENYARSTLPSNRWQLGWDIFKNNFGRIVLLNLLLLLFTLPVFVIIFFRTSLISFMSGEIPFESFMSYPFIGSLNGEAEIIRLYANRNSLMFLPIAALILSVGLSGILYIIRNLVWTEGVFVGSDFWRGIKSNFFIILITLLAYCLFLFLGTMSLSYTDYLIVSGEGNATLLTIANVSTYVMLGFITIMVMHMLTMSVTYKLGFFKLIRNAFILSIALLPFNIFFLALSFGALILYFLIPFIGIILALFFGMSVGLLIWTVYSHWIYDKFINKNVPGAKINRGIYDKPQEEGFADDLANANEQFDTAYMNRRPVKPITDYDIEIVELPESFNREDLRRLAESKEAMRRDSDQYVEDVLSGKINPNEPIFTEPEEEDISIEEFLEANEDGEETAENVEE